MSVDNRRNPFAYDLEKPMNITFFQEAHKNQTLTQIMKNIITIWGYPARPFAYSIKNILIKRPEIVSWIGMNINNADQVGAVLSELYLNPHKIFTDLRIPLSPNQLPPSFKKNEDGVWVPIVAPDVPPCQNYTPNYEQHPQRDEPQRQESNYDQRRQQFQRGNSPDLENDMFNLEMNEKHGPRNDSQPSREKQQRGQKTQNPNQIPCRYGKECNDDGCKYNHSKKQQQKKACKYGAKCNNDDCAYSHENGKKPSRTPQQQMNRFVESDEPVFGRQQPTTKPSRTPQQQMNRFYDQEPRQAEPRQAESRQSELARLYPSNSPNQKYDNPILNDMSGVLSQSLTSAEHASQSIRNELDRIKNSNLPREYINEQIRQCNKHMTQSMEIVRLIQNAIAFLSVHQMKP